MRTSKYKKVWAWLNGLREAPLGDNDKITNRSSSRCVSRKWVWSCKSMEVYKSQPKQKYAPMWHQMYSRSKNQTTSNHPSSNVQSQSSISTTESGSNIKETSPRRRSVMTSKCRKVWSWLNGPRETPLRDHSKITIDHQLDMHLVSDEDHVTPWRSKNPNQKGNMP